jgi:hypothetical protein
MRIHVDWVCLRTLRCWRKCIVRIFIILLTSQNLITVMRMELAEQVTRMGDTRNAYTAWVGNPKRERPVPGPRRKWEDNKMGGSEIERNDADWIDLALCGALLCTPQWTFFKRRGIFRLCLVLFVTQEGLSYIEFACLKIISASWYLFVKVLSSGGGGGTCGAEPKLL